MIRNITSGKILSDKAKIAVTIADKIFGMILKRNSNGIILKTRMGVHTFLMRKPIDVLILDDKGRVVVMRKRLKPNRIMLWNPKFDTVIELEEGLADKSNTKLGDKLRLGDV